MRFTIAKRAAFKAAVFASSLMLLGGAGYAAAQQGSTAHAPARASATPPPVKKHHPKPKSPKKHHPKTKGHPKTNGHTKQHGKPVHRIAPHMAKAATAHQKRAPGR